MKSRMRGGTGLFVLALVICGVLVGHDAYSRWLKLRQARLMTALITSNTYGTKAALARGADPNLPMQLGKIGAETGNAGSSALTFAVSIDGHDPLSVVQALIKGGARIDARDPTGHTPLVTAIQSGNVDDVQALLAAGANPYLRSKAVFEEGKLDGEVTPMEAVFNIPFALLMLNDSNQGDGSANSTQQKIYRMLRQRGVTPTLFQAIRFGDPAEVQTLFREGTNVHGVDENGDSPLEVAISRNNAAMVQLLLSAGADPNSQDGKHLSPLLYACIFPSDKIVRLLLAHGAKLSNREREGKGVPQTVYWGSSNSARRLILHRIGLSPDFYMALMNGDLDVVKKQLRAGADPNRPSDNHRAPLSLAVDSKKLEPVLLLLSQGADPNAGYPLLEAVTMGRTDMAQALLQHGAEVNLSLRRFHSVQDLRAIGTVGMLPVLVMDRGMDGPSIVDLLQIAAENNDPAMYRLLRKYGASPDLHFAASVGELEDVRSLIGKGVDVNAITKNQDTPLTLALMRDREQVALFLLEHGAQVDVFGSTGDCPLVLAGMHENAALINALIAHGAKVDGVSKTGDPALLRLAFTNHVEAVRALLAHGADINATRVGGQTALMRAVRGNHIEMVSLLLQKRADVNARSEKGENALSIAVKQKLPGIIDLLKRAGAKD